VSHVGATGDGGGGRMTDTQEQTMTITVDGKQIEARPGELLIAAAERAGIFIPRFCWHKRMDPVGACRMCLVDVEGSPPIPGSSERRPQTSCTTVVRDGMVVHTQFSSPQINDAQKTILELLLINHPLDCPICDRGGECPLQDQTQDYGPSESRFTEQKRRFEKPVSISPLIKLDRERCILCYRCTRFCEELSGDVLIGVMDRGPEAFIFPFYAFDGDEHAGAHNGAPRGPGAGDITDVFDSYFSGNTVQICPVGALTSTEYRFKSRPWDLQVVPTTCNLCASGCAIHAGVRVQDGNVVRFSAATNEDTNEEWLCDKGRYGNGYLSSSERLSYPYARKGADLQPVSWVEAFEILEAKLKPVIEEGGAAGLLIGESLCDEDAYVAQKFARMVLRTNNVDHRLEGGLAPDAIVRPDVTYDDVLSSDLVVIVSCDVREELPVLFLRLRIAATKRGLRIAIVHPREVALSEYAIARVQPLPGDEAATATALAALLDGSADGGSSGDGMGPLADALRNAQRPVVLLGPRASSAEAVRSWSDVARKANARFTWLPRRSGTYGALAAGAHPDLLPGWRTLDTQGRRDIESVWGAELPDGHGLDVARMLEAAAAGELKALWLVGADVIADVPDANLGQRAVEGAAFVVVQDVQATPALAYADLVLPGAAFVERDGTLTDWEGRRQPVRAAVDPPGSARADHAILAETARRLGRPIGCRTQAEAAAELEQLLASAPNAEPIPAPTSAAGSPAAPNTGALRLLTYRLLYDDGSRANKTQGITALTPGPFAELNADDAERLGITDGQNVTVASAHGSIDLPARVSTAIRRGAVFVPFNQPGGSARVLCTWDDRTPTVTVTPA
jgi:NADH-quinone oxidoreductase subunit G